MLKALVKSSFCRMLTGLLESVPANCWFAFFSPIEEEAIIGWSSFSQRNVNGKSPVPTTHCTLTRSPTFTSRANSNGVIFGGTNSHFYRFYCFHVRNSKWCKFYVVHIFSLNVWCGFSANIKKKLLWFRAIWIGVLVYSVRRRIFCVCVFGAHSKEKVKI